MKKSVIIVFLVAIFLFSGCVKDIPNENNGEKNQDDKVTDFQDPPTINGIGINLSAWNLSTNTAGDLFLYENVEKIFFEYGEITGKLNPHPEFFAPVGTKIYSVSEGFVSAVSKIEQSDDYNVGIKRGKEDIWNLNYEHVINPYVEVGDTVNIGDLIAEVSPVNEYYGKWALMIVTDGNSQEEHLTHCPYDLLNETVREEYFDKLMQFVRDWEEFTGEDVYDQGDWFCAGCVFEQFTEAEAFGGDLLSSDDPKLREVIEALQTQIEDEANRLVLLENEVDSIIENDSSISQDHYEELEIELDSLESIGSTNYDRVRVKLDLIRSNIE